MSERWKTREWKQAKERSDEKTATSAGSYLDQPFVLWKEQCTPAYTSALRMLEYNGWAAIFCFGPSLQIVLYLSLGYWTGQMTLLLGKTFIHWSFWYFQFILMLSYQLRPEQRLDGHQKCFCKKKKANAKTLPSTRAFFKTSFTLNHRQASGPT